MSNEHIKIETRYLDEAISKREAILKKYDAINSELDSIVKDLMGNWAGKGAKAFEKDITKVKRNMSGLYDVLKGFCDVIEDCKAMIAKQDSALGKYNGEQ